MNKNTVHCQIEFAESTARRRRQGTPGETGTGERREEEWRDGPIQR